MEFELAALVSIFIVPYLILAVIVGFLTAIVAEEKGYSGGTWFFAGSLFLIFGLIAAAGLPDRKGRNLILSELALLRDQESDEEVEVEVVPDKGHKPSVIRLADVEAPDSKAQQDKRSILGFIIGIVVFVIALLFLSTK